MSLIIIAGFIIGALGIVAMIVGLVTLLKSNIDYAKECEAKQILQKKIIMGEVKVCDIDSKKLYKLRRFSLPWKPEWDTFWLAGEELEKRRNK